jgi:hypothetical protein
MPNCSTRYDATIDEQRRARTEPVRAKEMQMLISAEMKAALTEQIGHEFAAMLQYVTIATYFESEGLPHAARDSGGACPRVADGGPGTGPYTDAMGAGGVPPRRER